MQSDSIWLVISQDYISSHTNSRFSTLINSHDTLVLISPGHESWENSLTSLATQLSSTLMQLLFTFDQDMTVEKTLIQTLASQLSSTLMQFLFSFDQDIRVERTLTRNFASQLSCNSCSRFTTCKRGNGLAFQPRFPSRHVWKYYLSRLTFLYSVQF